MDRSIRVTGIQLPAVVPGNTSKQREHHTLEILCNMLDTAGRESPDLVLLGEYCNLFHRSTSSARRDYRPDPIPGPFVEAAGMLARAHRMNVALPVFGIYRGVLSSWVVLLDRRGRITGCYQKAHPIVQEQRLGIRAGNDLTVFPLDCCRVGIMTCMDVEYPEVAQVLMLRGAELLLFPHVQGSWGEQDWEIRYRARSVDTGLYMVSACYGFEEGEWMPGKMVGRTSIIGRDGLILADAGRGIGMVTRDLDLDRQRITHFFFERKFGRTIAVQASRRPELYKDLAQPSFQKRALAALRRKGS